MDPNQLNMQMLTELVNTLCVVSLNRSLTTREVTLRNQANVTLQKYFRVLELHLDAALEQLTKDPPPENPQPPKD
jgi:hypothetical protein